MRNTRSRTGSVKWGVALAISLFAAIAYSADFNVRDFGAKGDGQTKDTAAIQQTINACAGKGGGRVVFADGTFLSGALRMKSGVELHIDRTATLLASPDIADFPDWPDAKHVVKENLPRTRNAAFVFADEAGRIAITGGGTIDCNGGCHIKEKKDEGWTGWKYERVHDMTNSLPRVVFLAGCSDVVIRDVTMVGQPAGWSYWIHDCDRVQISGLKILANVRYPVAVWWEHPLQALPERYLHKENWTFFNSTFGPGPGKEMGKYLLSRGVHDVAFFSPYHDSSWSIERLEGLREIGLSVMDCTDDEFASPWDYKQIARKKVEKHSVEAYARELLKQKMVDILKKCDYEQIPIVCVNDDVASTLLELHEEGCIGPLGQIFAFDNSAESYLLRLPSYDFNTQALVDRMFYSLVNRDAFRMQHRIQQVLGQVVEK